MKKTVLFQLLAVVVMFLLLVAANPKKNTAKAAGAGPDSNLKVTCSVDIVGPAVNANISLKTISDNKAVKAAEVTLNGVKFIDKYKNGWYFGTIKAAAGVTVSLKVVSTAGNASASAVMPANGKILNIAVTGGGVGSFFQLSNNYK